MKHYFLSSQKIGRTKILKKKWESLYQIKQEVNIAIEEKRTNKEIGSSLEADIVIHASEKEFNI